MRALLGLALLLVTIAAPASAQQPANTVNLEQYCGILTQYCQMGSSQNISQTATLAIQDPWLAKFPTIRNQTIAIFREIQAMEAANKSASDKQRSQMQRSSSGSTRGTSDSNNGRPPKPPKEFTMMQDQFDAQRALMEKQQAMQTSIHNRIEQISKMQSVPEGQRFSLPGTSRFLAAIDPFAQMKSDVQQGLAPTNFNWFEVSTSNTEGFFGYETSLANDSTGNPLKDSDGNYVHVADRSKNIFVRGYTKPVSMGEMIRIKVRAGETKTMNGLQVGEYIFVDP